MIIGIDLDEVLANFFSPFIKFHNKKYGTSSVRKDFISYEISKLWGGTEKDTMKKINEFYKTDDFENIMPIQGSVEAIKILNKNHKLEIITARQYYIAKETRKWINKHFPDKFSKINFANHIPQKNSSIKKSKICLNQNIDILIDDSLNYAKDCSSKGIKVLLFDCPWNQSEKLPSRIQRVFSWEEILENIKNDHL